MERKYLTLVLAGLTALALLLVGAMAFGTVGAESTAEQSATNAESTIHVNADGEATLEPDKGVVTVDLTAKGNDTDTVNDDLARQAEELTDGLEALGVEHETTSYGISEPWRADEKPYDFVGQHSFRVTTEETEVVGDIVDVAAAAGAEINTVDLTLTDDAREQLRNEAIENAMEDARSQAETIAQADGLQITHAENVDASQRSFGPVVYDMEVADDAAEEMTERDVPPTEIDVDEASVSYSVDVTYNATTN